MTERLKQLYRMIPLNGKGVADIGTDHGMIPILLAESGYTGNIYASDIADAPLARARASAEAAGVIQKIHFEQSDGLDFCPADQVDCILIAGMGGDTICRILDHCDWVFDGGHVFLFQPMTHAEVLRYWLIHNDFKISREVLVTEGQHIYQAFSATVGKARTYRDIEYLIGAFDVPREGAPLQLLIREILKRVQTHLAGLRTSQTEGSESTAHFMRSIYHDLILLNGDNGQIMEQYGEW